MAKCTVHIILIIIIAWTPIPAGIRARMIPNAPMSHIKYFTVRLHIYTIVYIHIALYQLYTLFQQVSYTDLLSRALSIYRSIYGSRYIYIYNFNTIIKKPIKNTIHGRGFCSFFLQKMKFFCFFCVKIAKTLYRS